MAHILVYLQRTPRGIHPASAVALCVARDLGSERGATVTALCAGDGGQMDQQVTREAARRGADVMTFCGPGGIEAMQSRLRPVHVLTPWTAEGLAAVSGLPSGPVIPRWIQGRRTEWGGPDAVTGIVAGTLPWTDLEADLDAEYQDNVAQVPLPDWVHTPRAGGGDGAEPKTSGLGYVAPADVDARVRQALCALGAQPVTDQDIERSSDGTYLWLGAAEQPVPEALGHRGPASFVVLLPGEGASLDPSWALADWVLPGPWAQVLADLQTAPWRRAMT